MRSAPARDGSLVPRYLTSFVGREREIAEVTALLMRDDVRLLTLVGPGGAGKTRLAVEAINRLGEGPWDDICFVSLVSVRDPLLVLGAIGQALGVHQMAGRSIEETIARFLRDRRALLVIDNFEGVTAAAPGIGRLLASSPGVTMLVTSRIALHISGEHRFVLDPLDTPDESKLQLEELHRIESVQLFLERAHASGHALTLDRDNAGDIVSICRKLDGLPLALELAAARCAILSPAALLELLKHGSGIMSGGPSDAPERHRSMHDAITWSYDLLSESEQIAFRQLAVFNGGFTLPAAEAVVDLPGNILDVVASLVAKSLVVPMPSNDVESRFTMLETLRDFGLDRLVIAGEEEQVRDRHASYYLQEAIEAEYAWCMFVEDGMTWLRRLEADQANLRDALARLERNGEILRCLRMAGALGPLWVDCGNLNEGQQCLDRLLADPRAVDSPERTNALATLSWVSNQQGRMTKAFALAEECLLEADSREASIDHIRCHILSGVAAATMDQYGLAIQRLEQAVTHLKARSDPPWIGNLLQVTEAQLGLIELLQGDIDSAEARFNSRYAYDIARGFDPGTSHLYSNQIFNELALVALARGRPVDALRLFQNNLLLALRYRSITFSIIAISDIAEVLATLRELIPAARLFGASEALHEMYGLDFAIYADSQRAMGLPMPEMQESKAGTSQEVHRPVLRPRPSLRFPRTMSTETLARSRDEGRRLSLKEAATEALAAMAPEDPATQTKPVQRLSARETDVLRLLAEGRSNRAIAETLSLSERTVEHHVTHILTKLDLDSRTSAATFAVRNGLI